MKLLFVANPTVGHTNFLISLAIHSQKKGIDVFFLLPGVKNPLLRNIIDNPGLKIDEKFKSNNLPHKLIPISLYQGFLVERIKSKRGLDEVLLALEVFSAGAKHYTNFLINECNKYKPDAIVYDYTFFPAISVSEKLNIPRVSIYHSGLPFLEYPIPLPGTTFKYGELDENKFSVYRDLINNAENKTKNKYEKIIGHKLNTNFILSPNSNFLNIVTTVIEAEYPRKTLPNTVHFSGPSIVGRMNNNEKAFFDKKDKKLIYISLGTVFNNQPELFLKIINSINLPDTEILVAAGSSYERLMQYNFNDNVHIEKFLPQINVLKNADIFITHGGKNSINESLAFGVPMILFPVGGEQEYNANLVEYINAGKNFSPIKTSFTNNDMNNALHFLMNDSQLKSTLKTISEKHNGKDGAERALDLIIEKLNNN